MDDYGEDGWEEEPVSMLKAVEKLEKFQNVLNTTSLSACNLV